MAVFLDFDQGDTLLIGAGTKVVFERKSGRRTRVRIESTQDVQRVAAGDPVPDSARQAPYQQESAKGRGEMPLPSSQRRMPSQG
ncbi:hypothetical protein [Dyella sp. 2RAB6]|uniref:hypothetical protein n=1 Tax=Dyella sp. 2RAB6 TaxID=3232992 RepID=UPI003F902472